MRTLLNTATASTGLRSTHTHTRGSSDDRGELVRVRSFPVGKHAFGGNNVGEFLDESDAILAKPQRDFAGKHK